MPMTTPKKPRETPTPRDQPAPRRPFYYPAGVGCFFWVFVLFLIWFLIGLWGGLVWWPWWW